MEKKNKGIVADEDGRTSVEGLFAVGWNTRLIRTQAIISAGQGAALRWRFCRSKPVKMYTTLMSLSKLRLRAVGSRYALCRRLEPPFCFLPVRLAIGAIIRDFAQGNIAMRFFNTSGPVVAADHYCIPPLERLNLNEIRRLIRDKRYFVMHAPRQTGKTSGLLALRDLLNAEGDYRCVYVNVEGGQALREDVERVTRTILTELASRARSIGDDFCPRAGLLSSLSPGRGAALREALTRWAEASPKPLVLLIDEIDALIGDALLSVLRQLRAGYDRRPESFPQSVILCGVRDVRDYRIRSSSTNAIITGGSAFNIKARSLRLGDFSRDEVIALLAQHTEETGQVFTPARWKRSGRRLRGNPGWSTRWRMRPVSMAKPQKTGAVRSPPPTSSTHASNSSCAAKRTSTTDGQTPRGAGQARGRATVERC